MVVSLLLLLLISLRAVNGCLSSGGLGGFGALGTLGSPLSPSCGCPGCSCSSYPASPQISYSHYAKPTVIQQSFAPPPPPPPPAVPLAPYSPTSYGSSYAQPTLIGTESQATFQQQLQQHHYLSPIYPSQPVAKQGSQALFQHTIITPASQYAPPSAVYHNAPETIAVAEPQNTQTVEEQAVATETPVAPPAPEDLSQTETNVVNTESDNQKKAKAEETEAVFPVAQAPTDITSNETPAPIQYKQQIEVPSSKKVRETETESEAFLEVKKEPIEERRMSFVTYYNQECSGQVIYHSNAETIQTATIKCAQLGCQSANIKPNIKGNYQVDFLTNVDSRLNKGGSYCLSRIFVKTRRCPTRNL